MAKCIIVFLLALICTPFAHLKNPLRSKDSEDKENYPFVVELLYRGQSSGRLPDRNCSGIALAKDWIVTSAHCITYRLTHIRYDNIQSGKKAKAKILKKIKRPSYIRWNDIAWQKNDIALLHTTPIIIEYFGKFSGTEFSLSYGINVTYAGYGISESDGSDEDRKSLLVEDGTIVQCPEEEISEHLARRYICVSPKQNATRQNHSLPNISGGPLIFNGKVIGVMSQVHHKHRTPLIVFAPISRHWLWLHREITSKRDHRMRKRPKLGRSWYSA